MMVDAMGRRIAAMIALAVCIVCSPAGAVQKGRLKLDVLDELGAGARPAAEIFAAGGRKVGEVAPGAMVELPAGTYKLVLPIVGGRIERDGVQVEEGRVHTVLISNVAVLSVSARKANGEEPGYQVIVTGPAAPHPKLAQFLTGDKLLFAPQQVDVKVDVPPQGYLWHGVTLQPGHRSTLEFNEEKPAELIVRTLFAGSSIDSSTRVVVYQAGTQKQAAAGEPGREHRFSLDPGDYDVYVENHSGRGQPYVMTRSVHLESGQTVERQVALDHGSRLNGK